MIRVFKTYHFYHVVIHTRNPTKVEGGEGGCGGQHFYHQRGDTHSHGFKFGQVAFSSEQTNDDFTRTTSHRVAEGETQGVETAFLSHLGEGGREAEMWELRNEGTTPYLHQTMAVKSDTAFKMCST